VPRLTFPFPPDGLLVPALLGLAAVDLAVAPGGAAAAAGLLHARGMIDTGTTVTAVAPGMLARLNVPRGPAVDTATAGGVVQVHFYQVSFTIYERASGIMLTRGNWTVTNLLHDLADIDVLFGLDLLREVVLMVNGPGQTFSLDF
jgi:hypothetical protein